MCIKKAISRNQNVILEAYRKDNSVSSVYDRLVTKDISSAEDIIRYSRAIKSAEIKTENCSNHLSLSHTGEYDEEEVQITVGIDDKNLDKVVDNLYVKQQVDFFKKAGILQLVYDALIKRQADAIDKIKKNKSLYEEVKEFVLTEGAVRYLALIKK